MKFYTTVKLGEKQSLTPEGFLLCEDVPAARTGTMIYGPDETPVPPGPDGIVKITRTDEEVFRPEFMASLNGKPVVNDHPDSDVTPDNWRDLSVGVGLNPRRGSGMKSDLLVLDIMITDKDAIEKIRRDQKREISLGYNADYDETGPGEGVQRNLVANHIALVDSGRCGPRCAIGDSKNGDSKMSKTQDKRSDKIVSRVMDRIRKAFKAKDEEGLEEALEDAEEALGAGADDRRARDDDDPGTHIHIHTDKGALPQTGEDLKGAKMGADDDDEGAAKGGSELEGRLAALEGQHAEIKDSLARVSDELQKINEHIGRTGDEEGEAREIEGELEEEAPQGTGDKARKAKDSAYLDESFSETVAAAEILAPGIRIPTYDRAAAPKKTLDQICKLRRTALDLAYNTPDGRSIIEEINGKPLTIDQMSCGAVRQLFRSSVLMKKQANNAAQSARTGDTTAAGKPLTGAVRSIADVNARNSEFWKSRSGAA